MEIEKEVEHCLAEAEIAKEEALIQQAEDAIKSSLVANQTHFTTYFRQVNCVYLCAIDPSGCTVCNCYISLCIG